MNDSPQYSSAVRDMTEEERPRERLLRLGPEALRDGELLAILFRTGTREEGAVALADRLVRQFVDLRGVANASIEELQQVRGLGAVKAIEVKAALELGKRLAQFTKSPRNKITCAKDVADYLMLRFKECESEEFKCVLMNTKNEIVKVVDVSRGGLDSTVAGPREVFRQAVRESAGGVIVCHNHPSGDPEPSPEDIALTKHLNDAATLLGIRFLDHIVFGDNRYVSLKERNLF